MLFIINKFLEFGADSDFFILGIGGGVVCDITGFSAGIFNRGLKFAFVASSLLAQADASIGGKNGINFKNFKNIIGTIKQPEFVLSDFSMLKTLPAKELVNGFAEIIKTAVKEWNEKQEAKEFMESFRKSQLYYFKEDEDG